MPPAGSTGPSEHAKIAVGITVPMIVLIGGLLGFIWYTESQRRQYLTGTTNSPPVRLVPPSVLGSLDYGHDKIIERYHTQDVSIVQTHPARTTSLGSRASKRSASHELSKPGQAELLELEKLQAFQTCASPQDAPSTPVASAVQRAADHFEANDCHTSPLVEKGKQSYELGAGDQIDQPKMAEIRMSYQHRASNAFRFSFRPTTFIKRKTRALSRHSNEIPSPSCSADVENDSQDATATYMSKDLPPTPRSAPRFSANIEFCKDGNNYNKEVAVPPQVVTARGEGVGTVEDSAGGLCSPTLSEVSRSQTDPALPDHKDIRFSHSSSMTGTTGLDGSAFVGIAELSDTRNSRRLSRDECPSYVQSPVSARFSDSPPSWMKRLSADRSQRSSVGIEEKLNEANAQWGADADERQADGDPTTSQRNTVLILSAASQAQRQRSRSRPRRRAPEAEPPAQPAHDLPDPGDNDDDDNEEVKQAEMDAMDIVESVSPVDGDFRSFRHE